MKKTFLALIALSVLTTAVQAQEMPAPRKMPREPVSRQALAEQGIRPPSREVQGPAAVLDGEKLRIGDADLRLFGIVPPQLSASFGPQARATLDQLAGGQNVSCQVRDRDRDGRLLATCRNAAGFDMALELLKRGLAVTARGSIADTELAAPYSSAEQSAQNQKIGIWAAAPAAAAVVTPMPVAAPAKQEPAPVLIEAENKTQAQAKIAAELRAREAQSRIDDSVWADKEAKGFLERYQILIASCLMLITALGIMGALWKEKNRDRSEETSATAAALRGELMAMRSVCLGRAKNINGEDDDKVASWPRLRATLYQAYVGRLGLLGAELARQIASIYGQAADYAALYNAPNESPKKQALENLATRIEEILPKLAEIERSGHLSAVWQYRTPSTSGAGETSTTATSPQMQAGSAPAIFARATASLWETVRNAMLPHKQTPPPAPSPEPQATDYAAMIEADMARYQQYGDNIEALDTGAQKKRG